MLWESPLPPGVVSKSNIFLTELVLEIVTDEAISPEATPKTLEAETVRAAAKDSSGP